MQDHTVSPKPVLRALFALFALVLTGTFAAAQANTFSGTYTFAFGVQDQFSVQTNMFGQQVGFCNNAGNLPNGYFCYQAFGQDVVTGTLVADGAGHIITGSSYVVTVDPNRYKCYKGTPDCPYKVPFGTAWNGSTAYVVGDEVDYTLNTTAMTFQAVENNTNVPPSSTTICAGKLVPPNCDWVQLYASATNKAGHSGTITGTYTVQANGSGVMKLTLTSPSGPSTSSFAIVVPSSPLAVGQVILFVGMPALGNEIEASGTAVRVQ